MSAALGGFLLAVRLLLAAVFGLAAFGKLSDPAGSRRALTDFGLPASSARPAAVLLPLLELVVALSLLAQPFALAGAIGALILLLTFTAAIGRSLAQGRAPDCHCFGQIHSEPAGWKTLGRNSILAGFAAFVIVAGWSDPGPSPVAWLGPLNAWRAALLAGLVVGLWLLLLKGRRTQGVTSQTLTGSWLSPHVAVSSSEQVTTDASEADMQSVASLAVGSAAPGFVLDNLDGHPVTLNRLREAGKSIVLFFSDPACGPCSVLLPEISRWEQEHGRTLTIALSSRGAADTNLARLGEHRLTHVLLQRDREVAAAYGALGTPAAVLVLADGTIGSATAQGPRAIQGLVARAVQTEGVRSQSANPSAAPVQALAVSHVAPDFRLFDLDGREVSLSQHQGQATLILFWNPGCGYCQGMRHQLTQWETLPSGSRPQLLVVSTGAVEENRATGFRSTVLLDTDFSVGRQYGARGTPSALLVDAGGHVVHELTVGAPAILALLGFRPGTALPAVAQPRRRDHIEDELLSDGSMLVYTGTHKRVYTLNGTAALVWDLCDGDQPIHAIVEEVRTLFPSAPDAEGDVRELLDTFLQDELIDLSPRAGAQEFARSQANA